MPQVASSRLACRRRTASRSRSLASDHSLSAAASCPGLTPSPLFCNSTRVTSKFRSATESDMATPDGLHPPRPRGGFPWRFKPAPSRWKTGRGCSLHPEGAGEKSLGRKPLADAGRRRPSLLRRDGGLDRRDDAREAAVVRLGVGLRQGRAGPEGPFRRVLAVTHADHLRVRPRLALALERPGVVLLQLRRQRLDLLLAQRPGTHRRRLLTEDVRLLPLS